MLFENNKLNNHYYDPSIPPDPLYHYSRMDCCHRIEEFTDAFKTEGYFELTIGERTIKRAVSAIKETVLERSAEDINRLIFYKKEFTGKLSLLNITEPSVNDTFCNARYLKLCYFFYLMDYFIFPEVRFFDLFKKESLSTENIRDSLGKSGIYQEFIMQSVFDSQCYHQSIDEYEKLISSYQNSFFDWYELKTYEYGYHYGCLKKDHSFTIPAEHLDSFNRIIKESIEQIDQEIKDSIIIKQTCDPFDRLLSTLKSFDAISTINDYYLNLDELDLEIMEEIAVNIKSRMPAGYDKIYLYQEDITAKVQDEEFLDNLISTKPLSINEKKAIRKAVDQIYLFESHQGKRLGNDALLFLEMDADGKYAMSLQSTFIIASVCIYLPHACRYYAKRTYLHNRSDSSRHARHSIIRSFLATDDEDVDRKNSMLRNAVFRIICHYVNVFIVQGKEEFLNFELPMNKMLQKALILPEELPDLSGRISYLANIIHILNKESEAILKLMESVFPQY